MRGVGWAFVVSPRWIGDDAAIRSFLRKRRRLVADRFRLLGDDQLAIDPMDSANPIHLRDQRREALGRALGCRDNRLCLLVGLAGYAAVAGDVVAGLTFDRFRKLS